MLILIGAFIVLASTIGGFMLSGGHPLVLLQVSSETTPAARSALAAAGVKVQPGPLRIEFEPR